MNKKDVFPITQEVAESIGLTYERDNNVIYLTNNNEDEITIVPYIKMANVVSLYIHVFNWDKAIDEESRAYDINQLNLQCNDCSLYLIAPTEEQPNEFRMIAKTDIILLSKTHFKRKIKESIETLINTKKHYVDILVNVINQLTQK